MGNFFPGYEMLNYTSNISALYHILDLPKYLSEITNFSNPTAMVYNFVYISESIKITAWHSREIYSYKIWQYC